MLIVTPQTKWIKLHLKVPALRSSFSHKFKAILIYFTYSFYTSNFGRNEFQSSNRDAYISDPGAYPLLFFSQKKDA